MEEKNETKKSTKPILILMVVIFLIILSININNNNSKDNQEIIANVPTIIDLGSDCYTCNQQKGYLDDIKEKYPDNINIKKIDVYDKPSEAEKYKVKVIPTLIFIDKNGKQVEKHEGLLTNIELEQKLIELGLISISCGTDGSEC